MRANIGAIVLFILMCIIVTAAILLRCTVPPMPHSVIYQEKTTQIAALPINTDGYVKDCISGYIVRKISENLILKDFTMKIPKSSFSENSNQRKKSFMEIYRKHSWGRHHGGPVDARVAKVQGSGQGSTLYWAQETMGALHILINEIKLKLGKKTITFLDIPCGDFVWMSRFLQGRTDIKYTGMDIVPSLIENHQKAFKNDPNLSFIIQDIVETPLNRGYDLIFSRHMLQHLTQGDIMKVLFHFNKSGSLYLLTTTIPVSYNTSPVSLRAGRFRHLNLEIPPVQLEPPICMTRDGPRDGKDNAWFLYLGFWKFPLRQVTNCKVRKIVPRPPGVKNDFYACN